MKLPRQWKLCVFLALLSVVVVVVQAQNDEDLADFEFVGPNDESTLQQTEESELERNDDYYDTEVAAPTAVDSIDRIDTDFDLFDDDLELDDQTMSFAEKEQRLKAIMLKVLANAELKRKFSEVIPMIRVMSSTQRGTLAHLITAQVNAKPGNELTLNQVKLMFGDQPALILPLIFDIANMIRTAAQREKFLAADKFHEHEKVPTDQYLRRSFTVRHKPHGFRKVGEDYDYDDDTVGTVKVEAPLSFLKDDRLSVEEDPVPKETTAEALPVPEALVAAAPQGRSMRSRFQPYFDRFVQSLPPIKNMKLPADAMTFHEKMLNMSAYNGTNDQIAMPSDGPIPMVVLSEEPISYANLTLEEIEDLAFSALNGTDDLPKIGNSSSSGSLPTPEKLISLFLRPSNGNKETSKGSTGTANRKQGVEPYCEKFTNGVCLSVEQYPTTLIMSSIRRNKHAMKALLAEYRDKFVDTEDESEEYDGNSLSKRREDKPSNGMCPSIIRYARPQKARSATGEWKYIVNTGQHTQTLRLEKCSNPQDSCSFLTDNYRSRCIQIFNYHRLLSWDQTRGLHVDIFKVPTCCSCHVDGYRESFPPHDNVKSSIKQTTRDDFDDEYRFSESIINQKVRPRVQKPPKYQTLNLNLESFENDDENIAMQFSNGFQRVQKPFKYGPTGFDDGPLLKKQRYDLNKFSKTPSYIPRLESYLSPPEYDSVFTFKRGPNKANPYEDQFLAGSENNQEVSVPPPLTPSEYDKRYGKHRGSIATSSENSNEQKLTNLKLLNSAAYELNGKRVNYNYHPILDFFSEKSDTPKTIPIGADQKVVARRRVSSVASSVSPSQSTATAQASGSLWKPMVVNGRPRVS